MLPAAQSGGPAWSAESLRLPRLPLLFAVVGVSLSGMASGEEPAKQDTQPRKKGAKPIEIPVPEREEIDRLLKKASKPLTRRPPK